MNTSLSLCRPKILNSSLLFAKRLLHSYRKNDSGQFAVISAVGISMLLLASAVAVDVSAVTSSKGKAQDLLDLGVMATAAAYKLETDEKAAKKVGRKAFKTQCNYDWCKGNKVPSFKIQKDGKDGFTVTGSYAATSESLLMGIFGKKEMGFKNISVASYNTVGVDHLEIHFVIDWSGSMGIASTKAEEQKLIQFTEQAGLSGGCAFACHMSEGMVPPVNGTNLTTYEIAKANGVKLLEDDMAAAVKDVVDDLFEDGSTTTKVGVYAVSDDLEKVKSPTNQKFSVTTALSTLDMEHHGTRFDLALPDLAYELGASGTGDSELDPQKAVILVTDGLNNEYYSASPNPSSFKASYCDGLKNNGVKVAVLHIPYPDLAGNSLFDMHAGPYLSNIPAGLQGCASEGLYFKADKVNEISDFLLQITSGIMDGSENRDLAFVQ